ncbi:hypothetical protein Zmor_011532 [Zophobas morio]|uniref:G domain-containing protein n=1 Tax=Zophobas morio TaxID=2755281 RepID=A0AA38IRM5_9CUCU|nr:hypothetical protein Zmor_011532 [Zophobas morio]
MFRRFSSPPRRHQSDQTDINLLLLGETGVGKSTFINSISNYFKYPTFRAAYEGKIDVLIPVCLNLSNGNKVYGRLDEDESHEYGQSATQLVKVYSFPIQINNRVLNLKIVDTPGVGDPRGIEQDNIHIDNILSYLSTLKKLHGICFVMKANATRFTSFVEYCLKQILTRLEKSASENIIFITTYSKNSQYSAGEAKYHCLQPLIRSIKAKPPHVDIPLNENNVFALDNEAFKALLEIQEGQKFSPYEIRCFAESWKVSLEECRRLLIYVAGDGRIPPLMPHNVENTMAVNEARFLIEQLATPLAEISELIQDNLLQLDRHKMNLSVENQSLNELKQKLYIPCVDLEVKVLNQPITVCTNTKCAEVLKVDNVTQWHYQQICHEPCFLEGVPREMVGDPGLTNCVAMNFGNSCIECGCNWRHHMHIYKTTEKIQVQKEDQKVRHAIKDKEDARVRIQKLMKKLNRRMKELENESQVISESIAKFSWFLQEHALTPFNDAYGDYIQQLITNEKFLGKYGDPSVTAKLEKLLGKHQNLQKMFQKGAQMSNFMSAQHDLSVEGIKRSISELYKLKHMGRKIEELIWKSTGSGDRNIQQKFKCVVSRRNNSRRYNNHVGETSTSEYYFSTQSSRNRSYNSNKTDSSGYSFSISTGYSSDSSSSDSSQSSWTDIDDDEDFSNSDESLEGNVERKPTSGDKISEKSAGEYFFNVGKYSIDELNRLRLN